MSVTAKGLGLALGGLRRLAELETLDRLNLRGPLERLVHDATRTGFTSAAAVGRTFAKVRRDRPARPSPAVGPRRFDLTPSDEQQMLVEAYGQFAAERLRPAAREADQGGRAPQELLAEAQQLGLLQLGVPTDFGGVVDERSAVTSVLAYEALARGDAGLTVAAAGSAALGTALALHGDGDQQATYLPALTSETPPVSALCLAEPQPLADPTQLRTRARRDARGFVLDGEKTLVLRVAEAELLLVAATLEGRPAWFLVESSTDGLTVRPDPSMGMRAAAPGRLHLEDVVVPATALVGGADPAVHADLVQRSRLAWCAVALGTSQAVLDYVIPYVTEREAFGEPIAHRQAVAFTVADIATELEGMRLATYRAAALADRAEPFAVETTTARSLCARHGATIGSHGVQLLGGHGYVTEHPVERWYRDLHATGIAEGALLV